MLNLAVANLGSTLLFIALYAVAAARYLPQAVFLACLPVAFALVTALWVRVEGRHRGLEALRRVGRIAAGLAVVVVGVPVLVLLPLFWLETVLPPAAGMAPVLPPVMTLVLIALALTVLVNVAGAVTITARRALGERRGGR
jgi:hypothetical protein